MKASRPLPSDHAHGFNGLADLVLKLKLDLMLGREVLFRKRLQKALENARWQGRRGS
ncbi:MAG: hypothetical protein AB7H77_05235 [Bdellovibrionales bacterium]